MKTVFFFIFLSVANFTLHAYPEPFQIRKYVGIFDYIQTTTSEAPSPFDICLNTFVKLCCPLPYQCCEIPSYHCCNQNGTCGAKETTAGNRKIRTIGSERIFSDGCGSNSTGREVSLPKIGHVMFSSMASRPRRMVPVIIYGTEKLALFDTGSDISIMRVDLFSTFKHPPVEVCRRVIHGIGKVPIIAMGCVDTEVEIQGNRFYTRFYVIPQELINYELIVGGEILKNAELCMKDDSLTIRKL